MDTSALAAAAADLISDRLCELLVESEELGEGFDTSLARRDLDGSLIVELMKLNDDARTRDDGTPVLRVTVQAVG